MYYRALVGLTEHVGQRRRVSCRAERDRHFVRPSASGVFFADSVVESN